MARYELRRMNVFSVVKTAFLLGALCGFLFGILEWAVLGFLFWAGENIPFGATVFDEAEVADLMGAGLGVMGVMLPLIGGFFGAVGGVITGFLLSVFYNLGARLWGGLEFEWGDGSKGAVISPSGPRQTVSGPGTPLPRINSPVGESQRPTSEPDRPPNRPSASLYE